MYKYISIHLYVRMMVYMVGGLLIAWMPLNLVNLYRDFFDITSFGPWLLIIYTLIHN